MKVVALLILLLLALVSCQHDHGGNGHDNDEDDNRNQCGSVHDEEQDLHDTLVDIIVNQWFPNTVGLRFGNIANMITNTTRVCFTARVDLGCYVGVKEILDYMSLIDPSIAEIIRYYSMNPVFVVADVVNRTVGAMVEQTFYSYATAQNYTALGYNFFKFDCNNKVTLMISTSDSLIYTQARVPPISDHNYTRICGGSSTLSGIQGACTGSNQVYASVDECVAYLKTVPVENPQAPFGFGNSVGCRDWHLGLARADPLVHCPHVSRTGGNRCCDTCF